MGRADHIKNKIRPVQFQRKPPEAAFLSFKKRPLWRMKIFSHFPPEARLPPFGIGYVPIEVRAAS